MKKLAFALLLVPFAMGCTSEGGTSEENLALVEQYIQAVENLDYQTMADLLDENYIGIGPSYGDSIRKEQAVENWKANVENLYEKIDYTRSKIATVHITSGENEGDWVSNWAELNITYKNGQGTVVIWANSNYQIENDKIVKSYTFYNEADALEQLGYVFINPNDL